MFGILPPTEDTVPPGLEVTDRSDEVAVDTNDENPPLPTTVESEGENAHDVEVNDSEEVQESIKSFCELVGIDLSTARGYLEVLVPAIRILPSPYILVIELALVSLL